MNADERHPVQYQEADMSLASAEPVPSPRTRRRWWLWLLVLGLIGGAAYALLPRLSQPEQVAEWRTRLPQVVATAYDTLIHRVQGTGQGSTAAEKPGTSGKAAEKPGAATRGKAVEAPAARPA